MSGIIYLASPYSHPEEVIRKARDNAAKKAAGDLMRSGVTVFSPIAHSHGIAEAAGIPYDWPGWIKHDLEILRVCQQLWILQLPGWEESRGIKAEVEAALKRGMPIRPVKPRTDSARLMTPREIEEYYGHRFD